MGPRDVVGVHPDIAGLCEVEGELIILCVVLADVDVVTVTADIVQRFADRSAGAAFFAGFVEAGALFASSRVTPYKSAVLELLPDLGEIAFVGGQVQGGADALQVVDL